VTGPAVDRLAIELMTARRAAGGRSCPNSPLVSAMRGGTAGGRRSVSIRRYAQRMAPQRDWTNRQSFGAGVLVSAAIMAAGLEAGPRWTLWMLMGFAALLGLALFLEPYFNRRRDAREQARRAKEDEARKRQEREHARSELQKRQPLESFIAAADATSAQFRAMQDGADSDDDWRLLWDLADKAIALAEALPLADSQRALRIMRVFRAAERGTLDTCSVPAAELSRWSTMLNSEAHGLRRDAGLGK